MAAYIYTVKDRQTDEILFKGYQRECGDIIGCDPKYIRVLSEKERQSKASTKYSKFKVERQWDERAANVHGGKRIRDMVCRDCGILMKDASAKRQRCPECAAKWAVEHNRIQMRQRRNQEKTISVTGDVATLQARMQAPCLGCVYFTGELTYASACNYIFIENKRRPCPPGKACTEKTMRRTG